MVDSVTFQETPSNPSESNQSEYETQLKSLRDNMQELPPTEMTYYMAVLVAAIEHEENREQYVHLLNKAEILVLEMRNFYDNPKQAAEILVSFNTKLQDLIDATEMHSTSHQIKKAFMLLCTIILSVVIVTAASVIGLLAGLLSDYTIIGNITGAWFGFLTGIVLGSYISTRLPELLFQSTFERKLEYCAEGIAKVGREFSNKKELKEYYNDTKEYILKTYFNKSIAPEQDYEDFLNSKQQFQICTTTAGFISRKLKGHLGHHFLIRYKINGIEHTPIEFGDRIKTPHFVDQFETHRTVTGQKLVDMLVLDRILQETHEYNLAFLSTYYQIADNDCRTYVEKILIGTGQRSTLMERFNAEIDKWTSKKIVGPSVRFFSKLEESELDRFDKYSRDSNNPLISAAKWVDSKSIADSESVINTFVK